MTLETSTVFHDLSNLLLGSFSLVLLGLGDIIVFKVGKDLHVSQKLVLDVKPAVVITSMWVEIISSITNLMDNHGWLLELFNFSQICLSNVG
jgi:hypothetical protein